MMAAKKFISKTYLIVVKLREFLNVLHHIPMVIKFIESLGQCSKEDADLKKIVAKFIIIICIILLIIICIKLLLLFTYYLQYYYYLQKNFIGYWGKGINLRLTLYD